MKRKIFYSIIVFTLLCFSASVLPANPIPVPTLMMPEEWISVNISGQTPLIPEAARKGRLEAAVYGLYPMRNMGYEKVLINDPVPPGSHDIAIALDGNPLKWTWSGKTYPTVLPEWPQIPELEWTIAPVPNAFKLTAQYKHGLIYRNDELVFFYPMGCWEGQPIYSASMTAHLKTLLPGRYLPKGVFLDNDPAPFSLALSPDMKSPLLHWVVSGDYKSKPYRALDRDYILTLMDRWGDAAAWFSQPPNMADGIALPSMEIINTPVPADDFVLDTGTINPENLGRLQFWGTYPGWRTNVANMRNADVILPRPDFFGIRIYDTAPTLVNNEPPRPGRLVYEYISKAYNQQFFGSVVKEDAISSANDPGWSYHHIFSYNITLPKPFIPKSGQRYWLSVYSGPVQEAKIWAWVTSPVPDLIPGAFINNTAADTSTLAQNFNLAFVLAAANITADITDTETGKAEAAIVPEEPSATNILSYRLLEGSTLTAVNPYEPAARPHVQLPVRGSFALCELPIDTIGQRAFKLMHLEFLPANGDEKYRGKGEQGLYRFTTLSTDPHQQLMNVSIAIGGSNELLPFTSGIVRIPDNTSFPWIDISISNTKNSTETSDISYIIHLVAYPIPELSFSTQSAFTSGSLGEKVGDGDLLHSRGKILFTNSELISSFNLYPAFAEQQVGLDALSGPFYRVPVPDGTAVKPYVLFSSVSDILAEEKPGQGDILSNQGLIILSNIDLIAPFGPMPPIPDMGLDALAIAAVNSQSGAAISADVLPEKGILLFSTEMGFFSERLGVFIDPGDILTTNGVVYKTSKELLRNFRLSLTPGRSIGLDAVHILPDGEIWFSTTSDFTDARLGKIRHGDLLSDNGRIVLRNLDLLAPFAPLEKPVDFGLDSLHVLSAE